MAIEIGRWSIETSSGETAAAYLKLPDGPDCTCCWCQNFMAAITLALPPEFLAILEKLGVDPRKPAEITDYGFDTEGMHFIGGWYHLFGEILMGRDAFIAESDNIWSYDLEPITPGFSYGFTNRVACQDPPFKRPGVIQIEFQSHIPWLLAEPDPT